MEISQDKHPQIEITFGGKHAHRSPETVDAEEFIGKKGIQAKGKKVSQYEVAEARFGEPVHRPEDDIEEEMQSGDADGTPEMPQDDTEPTFSEPACSYLS